jgi:hypothetical protein
VNGVEPAVLDGAGDPSVDAEGNGHLEQPHVPVKKRGRRR